MLPAITGEKMKLFHDEMIPRIALPLARPGLVAEAPHDRHLPAELEEAGLIDGCSCLGVLARIENRMNHGIRNAMPGAIRAERRSSPRRVWRWRAIP